MNLTMALPANGSTGYARPMKAMGTILAAAAFGTTSMFMPLGMGTPTNLSGSNWVAMQNQAGEKLDLVSPVVSTSTPSTAAVAPLQTSSLILATLREKTSMTWDQIARYFGVSRRSIHLWAAGGRISAANEEALIRVGKALSEGAMAGYEPSALRKHLLENLQHQRPSRASSDFDINRPARTA